VAVVTPVTGVCVPVAEIAFALGVAVADGIADVGSVAVGAVAMVSVGGNDSIALVFGADESVAGGLSLVQPWMSRPPMKTTCTIKIVKKAIRMVDLFFEGDVPCGTNGLGVFIVYPVWLTFVEVFVLFFCICSSLTKSGYKNVWGQNPVIFLQISCKNLHFHQNFV
jgi:hypothetical protein